MPINHDVQALAPSEMPVPSFSVNSRRKWSEYLLATVVEALTDLWGLYLLAGILYALIMGENPPYGANLSYAAFMTLYGTFSVVFILYSILGALPYFITTLSVTETAMTATFCNLRTIRKIETPSDWPLEDIKKLNIYHLLWPSAVVVSLRVNSRKGLFKFYATDAALVERLQDFGRSLPDGCFVQKHTSMLPPRLWAFSTWVVVLCVIATALALYFGLR